MQNKEKDIKYCGVNEQKIKNAQPTLDTLSLELFTHWINERYKIHIYKDVEGKPRPWTTDKILANYRFTNVRREMDRQTKYLIDNIVNNSGLSMEEKIVNIIIFRYWNLWDTMRDFGGPWSIPQFMDDSTIGHAQEVYNKLVSENAKHGFFTKAFFTSGAKINVKKAYGRENTVLGAFDLARDVINKDIPNKILQAQNQEEATNIIKTLPGIAGFLSYQMFVDMTYIPEFPFSENEFTVAGPGCKNGLRRLFENTDKMTAEECIFWLRDNLCDIAPQLNPVALMTDLPVEERFISVMSLENCLCEFSKYHRAYHNQGRPKQKYIPTKE